MSLKNLIILPCHSVWSPGPSNGISRNEWSLQLFQLEGNDHLCFVDHVKKSLDELKSDKNALLIISGGQTKKDSGPKSEAYSYYQLALALCEDISLLDRIGLEEFARDSFENVLFLICRFYEYEERYPLKVTVVGFEFKRERFVKFHLLEALSYPEENVSYIGNAPDPQGEEDERAKYFENLEASEMKHALAHFQKDWYGTSEFLLNKKRQRNPFKRIHGYGSSNQQLLPLFAQISDHGSSLDSKAIKELVAFPWV